MWYELHVENRTRGIQIINDALEDYQSREVEESLPRDFAVFCFHDRDANAVTFFFAPGAGLLAVVCEAETCDRPPAAGLELLAGNEEVWNVFPDRPVSKLQATPVPVRTRMPEPRSSYRR